MNPRRNVIRKRRANKRMDVFNRDIGNILKRAARRIAAHVRLRMKYNNRVARATAHLFTPGGHIGPAYPKGEPVIPLRK